MENIENKEILALEDIKLLVDTFYTRVRQDALLAPVFENKIRDQWDKHLDIMYRFWQTVLLKEHTYQGSPFIKHIDLPVSGAHFRHWISIFHQTVDDLFSGSKAEEAKWRADRMAEMFMFKLGEIKQNKGIW